MLSKRKRVKQVEAELSKRRIVWKGEEKLTSKIIVKQGEECQLGGREVIYGACS